MTAILTFLQTDSGELEEPGELSDVCRDPPARQH